jgi:hypothetical protein
MHEKTGKSRFFHLHPTSSPRRALRGLARPLALLAQHARRLLLAFLLHP